MVQQNNFTVFVRLPETPSAHSVLRVRYVSHAPTEVDPENNTDAIFYNCADVTLVAPAGAAAMTPAGAAAMARSGAAAAHTDKGMSGDEAAAGELNCGAPSVFEAQFVELNPRGSTRHVVLWDGEKQKTRWLMTGNIHTAGAI